jgi:hypothetical protein
MLDGLNSSHSVMMFGLLDVPCCGNIAHTLDDQLGARKLYSVGVVWDLGLRIGYV